MHNQANRCPEEYEAEAVYLICDLPRGHAGPHWDKISDLTWKRGKISDLTWKRGKPDE